MVEEHSSKELLEQRVNSYSKHLHMSNVADPDPGSGAFLTPGSGTRNRFFPDPGSQTHTFESLVTIFWLKSSIILWKLAQIFFFSASKLKYTTILWNLWLHKKVWHQIFSPHSFVAVFGSGIRDPGSGMGKNQDPGSGINIPDPQHCIWARNIFYICFYQA